MLVSGRKPHSNHFLWVASPYSLIISLKRRKNIKWETVALHEILKLRGVKLNAPLLVSRFRICLALLSPPHPSFHGGRSTVIIDLCPPLCVCLCVCIHMMYIIYENVGDIKYMCGLWNFWCYLGTQFSKFCVQFDFSKQLEEIVHSQVPELMKVCISSSLLTDSVIWNITDKTELFLLFFPIIYLWFRKSTL